MKTRTKVYLDFIRLIAIFLIIINHTPLFSFSEQQVCSILYCIIQYSFHEIIKMAVPLFFMISGALLLPREEGLSDLYRKRVFRFITVFFVIVSLQYGVEVIFNNEVFSIKKYVAALYTGAGYSEFWAVWFLQAYIGILLMLPIIRILAKGIKIEHLMYALIIQFITCCILPGLLLILGQKPINCFITSWLPFNSLTPPLSYGYCIFYMFLGHIIEQNPEAIQKSTKKLILLGVGSIIIGALCMYVCTSKGYESNIFLFSFLPIPCITVYSIIRSIFIRIKLGQTTSRIISKLGAATFTVMLTENIFRIAFRPYILETFTPYIGYQASCLILATAILLVCLSLGLILKMIPGVRKFI